MPVLDGGAPDPDLPPLPYLPALPAAAVASVSRRRRCPCRRCSRPACRWGRAPRLSRPWPDRTIRARPRAFPAAVPSACLSPPCAAFPVHDPRAASARARPSDMQRQRRTVMQNPSFEFPAPWRWPRPWPPSFRRPRPAGARLRHGSGGHHRRRARFAADLHHQSQDAAPAAAGQRRHRLPEDHSRLLGHPQWRHQRRSGAARHVRFAPEHPDQRQRHARRLPGAHGRAQLLHFARDLRPAHRHQGTADRAVGPRRLGRHRALRPRHAALHRGRRALRRQPDRRLVRPQ